MKTCYKCKEEKALDSFHKDKYQKDGHKALCKACAYISTIKWVAENTARANELALSSYHRRKEAVSQRRKELRALDPEKYRQQAKETRKKNPEHYMRRGREAGWKRAGIVDMDYERYTKMLEDQNHCCAICKIPQHSLKKNLFVDHNHITGEVRGLLCPHCNSVIGYIKESKQLLTETINYLERHDKT